MFKELNGKNLTIDFLVSVSRKKSKVKENIEFYSVMRSIRSIERSDVCFLVFDANREFDSQVQNIFWLVKKNNKGIVILVNKWDLVKKSTRTIEDFINKIKKRIAKNNRMVHEKF